MGVLVYIRDVSPEELFTKITSSLYQNTHYSIVNVVFSQRPTQMISVGVKIKCYDSEETRFPEMNGTFLI